MKRIRYIMGICWAFLLGGLMACSSEEDPAGPTSDEGYRTLSIEIGAEGSLATKAYADDENAYEHEFMNELCVFVVDKNGKIEKKFLYSGETKNGEFTGEPEAGNAYEWRSGDFELPTGTKTIYAFANWSGVNNEEWNEIISKVEGSNLNDSELSDIAISKPAETINFNDDIYIPMSVKYGPFDFQVSQTARVELIRLVGRVDGTITNNRASDITVKSVTMRPFATEVPLMFTEGTYKAGVEANAVTYTFASPLELASGASGIFRFYVNETANETANENPFAVEVLLGDDKRMTGALKNTKAIPRNHFLPLALNISDNDFDLYIMAYIAPIGGYPIQVMPNSPLGESEQTAGLYSAKLPEGCSFQVFGSVVSGGVAGEQITCSLSLKVPDTNSPVKIDDTGQTAYVTSLSGQQETLSVTFTDANNSRRTADLSISTEPLKDLDEYGIQTNGLYLRQWQAAPAWYEVVPLRMANPE